MPDNKVDYPAAGAAGDGLGGGSSAAQQQRPIDLVAQDEAMRNRVSGYMTAMGTAAVMRTDRVQVTWTRFYNHVRATTPQGKADAKEALIYMFIIYGTSPGVDWTGIDIVCNGTKYPMLKIVDNIVGRTSMRKFARTEGAMAMKLVNASPDLRTALRTRAVKRGIPSGVEELVVDFVGEDGELDASRIELRLRGKSYAIQDAELKRDNRPTREADDIAARTVAGAAGRTRSPDRSGFGM